MLWRSGLELLTAKFHHLFGRVICCDKSILLFKEITAGKLMSMDFHKLGLCTDVVVIWFGIAYGKILSIS